MTVDELVANALLTEFQQDQIYHDNLPEDGRFPAIMYTDLSIVPSLHADNRLYGYEHVIRVTIVTRGNSEINALKSLVYNAMVNAGFMWENTNKVHDKNEYYTSLDFSIGRRLEHV